MRKVAREDELLSSAQTRCACIESMRERVQNALAELSRESVEKLR